MAVSPASPDPNAPRRRWMGVLARASAAEIEARLAALPAPERAAMAAGLSDGYRAMFAGAAAIMGLAAVMAWRVPLRRV